MQHATSMHAQSCPILCDPMDCSPPGSTVHGIFQIRILEWIAISSSRESSWTRDSSHISYVSCIGRWILYHWATWEAPFSHISYYRILSRFFSAILQFSSVQSLSRVRLFATPWTVARQASLSITNSQSSLKLMSIESVMPSSNLILCRRLLLPPIPPSIRVFSSESTLHMRWPKYWSFSFSIIPSKEHTGLISFRWTGWISCSPRESQESSPTPQVKSINSSALSFLHSPTLTSIHDHWRNHSLD